LSRQLNDSIVTKKLFHIINSVFSTMKQLISVLALFLVAIVTVNAQAVSGPKMEFQNTTIDYGTVAQNSARERKFSFTNTGNEPLIIKSAKGSNRVGQFTKTVTIVTNEAADTHTLTIKGEVKGEAKQESVPAGGAGLPKG
jgi:hypothetical protein